MLRTFVVISTLFLCRPPFLLINPKRANDHFVAYGIEKHPMTVVYEQEITKKELLMRKMQLISCVLRPKSISLHQGDTVNEMQDKLHAQIE